VSEVLLTLSEYTHNAIEHQEKSSQDISEELLRARGNLNIPISKVVSTISPVVAALADREQVEQWVDREHK